jgi:hypothetical protein
MQARPNLRAVSRRAAAIAALGALLALCPLSGAELKVDINNSGRPVHEGLDPAFTPWSKTTSWLGGGDKISADFAGVAVTFTRVGSVGSSLQTGYWKSGVQNSSGNLKLTADGLKVADGEAGAQIEMRIAGLTPGAHTVLLYLNSWDDSSSIAPLDILVNGAQVIDDLPVSSRVTDNTLGATAYLAVNVEAGRDVVVLLKAEARSQAKSRNVHINGFEIDAPNPKAQMHRPVPVHADEHVDADNGKLTLAWATAPSGAVSGDLYFGTDAETVRAANRSSPEFKGGLKALQYPVEGLKSHLTYYWRVDSVASDGAVTKGNLWYFRPRQLAFPGAEGYGRFARGGRGGVVVKVTNLNDSGPGSFRDAIEGDYGPRTVIFDVGGLITLQDDLIVDGSRPYITIAGQTAPGKGICVKRQMFGMSGARDVVCRFIRIFPGKESGETQNATGMAGVDHCIMDHCSFGWGLDEAFSSRGAKNLTLQRSLISEMLNIAGHDKKKAGATHGFAASIGGDIGSFHHNLLAHNEGRNWSMAGGLDGDGRYSGRLDIFNNVVYNWGGRTTDGGAHQVNFVNNYYKPGPATTHFVGLTANYGGFPGTQQYYVAGNVMPGKFTAANQSAAKAAKLEGSGGTLPEDSKPPYRAWVDKPFFPSHATIHSAANAYKQVLSDVGCNQPRSDDHDLRLLRETFSGTTTYKGSVSGKRGLPDTTDDVGGWEDYGREIRPAGWDTDNDGLPDWWEMIKGLNPRSPAKDFSESNADPDGDGFTQLEDYLTWLAAPTAECRAGSSIEIDLLALSRGYAEKPTYTFSSASGGTVTLVKGRHARFTPDGQENALGGFSFTVTDAAGDSMTRTVGIRIIAGAASETANRIR